MTLKTYDLSVPLARNPVIVVTVFGVVATLTTVSRFLALRMRNVKPGAPEYLIIGALVRSDELYKSFVAKFAAQVIVYIFIAIQYICWSPVTAGNVSIVKAADDSLQCPSSVVVADASLKLIPRPLW